MRTARTAKRKRQSIRVPARGGVEVRVAAADVPVCVNCGQPLIRLPHFLTSQRGSEHGFQCQRCFYANSKPAPSSGEVIASDRTRWLTQVLSEGGEGPPRSPRDSER